MSKIKNGLQGQPHRCRIFIGYEPTCFDKDTWPQTITEVLPGGPAPEGKVYEFTFDGQHYVITDGLPKGKAGTWAITAQAFRKLESCDNNHN